MNPTQFIKRQKLQRLKKSLEDGKLPEQGSYVSLFNNDYKMLTKGDVQICILEDARGNKVPYAKAELLKLLKKAKQEEMDLLKAEEAKASAKPTFAVGEVHNGRKKIVSSKTGKTMWVDVTQGHAFADHDSTEAQSTVDHRDQVKSFFDSVGDKIHPGDKMKIIRQLKDVMALKQRIQNMKEVASHDLANKQSSAKISRDKMFSMQETYSAKFKELKEALVTSAKKRKAEGL